MRPERAGPTAEIGSDWASAFRAGAAEFRAALRQVGDLSQEIDLPIGRAEKSFVTCQQIAEFAVHSWDLAVATGQRATFPVDACGAALAWAGSALLPELRGDEASGKSFRLEVPVHGDALAEDRLAVLRSPSRAGQISGIKPSRWATRWGRAPGIVLTNRRARGLAGAPRRVQRAQRPRSPQWLLPATLGPMITLTRGCTTRPWVTE